MTTTDRKADENRVENLDAEVERLQGKVTRRERDARRLLRKNARLQRQVDRLKQQVERLKTTVWTTYAGRVAGSRAIRQGPAARSRGAPRTADRAEYGRHGCRRWPARVDETHAARSRRRVRTVVARLQ